MAPVIIGPTAAGKSTLAMGLARANTGYEIVSADSRQVYIGLDIGTAKPTPVEQREVSHHMIDIISPDEQYAAGRYAGDARRATLSIVARGARPIIVGGSGFYVRALFEGLGAPEVDPELLTALSERMAREGPERLHAELERLDPAAAARHSRNNRVRTLRALACYYGTGRRFSDFSGERGEGAFEHRPLYIGVAPPRALLYERIDARVIEMVEQGLIEETERVLESGVAPDAPGLRTVGYVETIAHLRGQFDRARMIADIQQATRRYAKRQMTWFRRVPDVHWLDWPDVDAAASLIDDANDSRSR